mmetsp:Transcript_123845/g.396446  ORF Transcript_123845/g.396446 Transcript_123845/m.396446 type:complete len:537 (-) Transcript_123845:44-1654(-)
MRDKGSKGSLSAWDLDPSGAALKARGLSRSGDFENVSSLDNLLQPETDLLDSDEETVGLLACMPDDSERTLRNSGDGGCCARAHKLIVLLVKDDNFGLCMAGFILLNTAMMAVQIDNPDWQLDVFGQHERIWVFINLTFLFIFVTEIAFRIVAEGYVGFFTDPHDWSWNLFDFLVVAFGVCDQVLFRAVPHMLEHLSGGDESAQHDSEGGGASRAVMAARVLRIVRVLRVLRIFHAFRKLRMLVRGMLESVEIVSWIGVLVLVVIFISSIVTTTVIGQNVSDFPPEDQADIEECWGSIGKSMFTLFQFLTMDGWSAVYYQVTRTMPWMVLFFFPFIFFGAFVILSLLTGVMADHMNDVRRKEEEEERKERLMRLDTAVEAVRANDLNRDGALDMAEFTNLFDERTSTFCADLKELGVSIKRGEAGELFDWFDVDGDSKVDYEELRHGVKHLYEGLTPLSLFRLSASVRSAERFVCSNLDLGQTPWSTQDRQAPSRTSNRELIALDRRLDGLEKRSLEFERQVRSFMEKFGWQPPES